MQNLQFSIGKEISLEIDGLSSEGDGVGRSQGMVFFVPYTVPGEKVRARITVLKKNFGRAMLAHIIEPSTSHIKAPCPVFGSCGGCQLQHTAYPEQLRIKEQRVRDALARIACVKEPRVQPIIGMDQPWRYRNKAGFAIGNKNGLPYPGFFRRDSHEIVGVDDCLLCTPGAVDLAHKALACSSDVIRKHRPFISQLIVRNGVFTGERMVIFVTVDKALPDGKIIAENLAASDPALVSIINLVIRNGSGRPEKNILLWGQPSITERLGRIKFSISPDSFFQVNSRQADRLYTEAVRLCAPEKNDLVLDAYSGVGGFAIFFAPHVAAVTGIEAIKEAVHDAMHNAQSNDIANARFFTGDMEGKLAIKTGSPGYTILIADPPRRGLSTEFINQCLALNAPKILCSSCDPATLARDIRLLNEGGFQLETALPIDMFPQTAHVECIALLVKS